MTNVQDTNVYKLFNTILPTIDYYDEGGFIDGVDYYVDIAEGVRLIFVFETDTLKINGVDVGEIAEDVAGELLNLVRALGYTESHS